MTDILEGLAVLLHRRAQSADAEDVVRRFIRALVRLRRVVPATVASRECPLCPLT
ncbi:MAG: hypothetical protein HC829_08025 [Bacteroidales bacterium]|nr:hypothetical protein [Bacteroidales bacterium]